MNNKSVYSNIRLRPTRIGFLVSPTDRASIRKIFKVNSCLWGGQYNPIIPVLRTVPGNWQDKSIRRESGAEITKGYIRFFEPDVYVEAKTGLLEKAGLKNLRINSLNKHVASLGNFFDNEFQGIFHPYFGQSVFDIIENIYLTERKFQLRETEQAIYSRKESDVLSEILIGIYPEEIKTRYFKNHFYDVFRPNEISFDYKLWIELFNNKYITPLSITSSYLKAERYWHDDPVIYVFDPSKTTDLVDLWNLRIRPSPVFPVPINWLPKLSENLLFFIEKNYRPLKNNPNGVMHKTTLEVSSSISEEKFNDKISPLFRSLQQGELIYQKYRTRIWAFDKHSKTFMAPERIKLTSKEKSVNLDISNRGLANFKIISPEFCDTYSGSKRRWANVVSFSSQLEDADVATVIPFNTFNRNWPNSGFDAYLNTKEGWVFLPEHKDSDQYISFLKQDEAFIKYFKSKNVTVSLSEAGRIAKQMLINLGGLFGLNLFDDESIIKFVDDLAHSRTTKKNENGSIVEDEFSGKSASIQRWNKAINDRTCKSHIKPTLNDYIEKNVAKLGLETKCKYCGAKNWHGLDEASYSLHCSGCLKTYPFPQGEIKSQMWKYRVIGPFATPGFAQGAYTSLLTIRFFRNFLDKSCTFSTAMDIFNGNVNITDLDFMIWVSENNSFRQNNDPTLIIGEAKSFGNETINANEIDRFKKAAELMPGSTLVFCVLKNNFSDSEKSSLRQLVRWSRETTSYGPKHPIILLTGTELFNLHLVPAWKELGDPHDRFADYSNLNCMESLSDATLSIYLGEPPYSEWYKKNNTN